MTVDDLLNTPEPTEADLKAHGDEYRADLKKLEERGIVLDGERTTAKPPLKEWAREQARIIREFARLHDRPLLDAFYFAQRGVIYEGWRQYPECPDPLFDVQIALWGDPGEAATVTEHVAALKKLAELALAEAARLEAAATHWEEYAADRKKLDEIGAKLDTKTTNTED